MRLLLGDILFPWWHCSSTFDIDVSEWYDIMVVVVVLVMFS